MPNIAINVDGAAYSYRRGGGFALHPMSVAVPCGGRLVLVGSNGAGKSTLLRLIAGRAQPQRGSVTVLGESAFECTRLALEITYVGNEWDEAFNVPVRQLLAGAAQQVEPGRATKLLVALGLDASLLTKDLSTISSGQRHRVQLLCSLLPPRAVILLDEATNTLDIRSRNALLAFLKDEECLGRGATVVFCTHIFDGLDGWATQLAHIEAGQLLRCVPSEALPPNLPLYKVVLGWMDEATPSGESETNAASEVLSLLLQPAQDTAGEDASKRAKLTASSSPATLTNAPSAAPPIAQQSPPPSQPEPPRASALDERAVGTSAAPTRGEPVAVPLASTAEAKELPPGARVMVGPLQAAIAQMTESLAKCSSALGDGDDQIISAEVGKIAALWTGTQRALHAFNDAVKSAPAVSAAPASSGALPLGWGNRQVACSEAELVNRGIILPAADDEGR